MKMGPRKLCKMCHLNWLLQSLRRNMLPQMASNLIFCAKIVSITFTEQRFQNTKFYKFEI